MNKVHHQIAIAGDYKWDTSVNGHSRGLIRVNYEGALLQTIDLNQKKITLTLS